MVPKPWSWRGLDLTANLGRSLGSSVSLLVDYLFCLRQSVTDPDSHALQEPRVMIFQTGNWHVLVLILFIPLASRHIALVQADADFWDVRTNLDRDRSGKAGDSKDKYFHEAIFDRHYDGRFASNPLPEGNRLSHLAALMQTFLTTMSDIGAESWIVHGTLLGWFWNQKILPWDSDLDVQVSERTIHFLAKYYNMTEYRYRLPGAKTVTYLLEINPHYKIRGVEDHLNAIDARWIDTETGLYIDITTVRANYTARAEGIEGALMCKDRHHYLERDIFPLRDTFFEGIHTKVPFEYAALLKEEYGEMALTRTTFEQHHFNAKTKTWERLKAPPDYTAHHRAHN